MIAIWAGVRKWWNARQRRIDMDMLWPICLRGASDLDHAKAAFAYHCFNDPAWTNDFTHDEIVAFIDRLEYYD